MSRLQEVATLNDFYVVHTGILPHIRKRLVLRNRDYNKENESKSHQLSNNLTYGSGMMITTSFSSRRSSWSSNSILTSHPPRPFSAGQQLTIDVENYKILPRRKI